MILEAETEQPQVSPQDRARAVLELRRRQEAARAAEAARKAKAAVPDRYGRWIGAAVPRLQKRPVRWDAPHFVEMQRVLDSITAGKVRRAYFQIPIRHGKSEHNTIAYAAYRLERDPTFRIIIGSYSQRQANRFSRRVKTLFVSRGGRLSAVLNSSAEWETEEGGGVLAVGSGTGVASVNADLIIIDDPIGKRSDAESLAERDRVWDWITGDLLGRAEPHTAVIFTMSRWHTDDPAGRLIARFGELWAILDLPGTAADPKDKDYVPDPLGREPGEPLWPAARGLDWHREKRTELGDYGYASQVQGRPRPREGGMFKYEWWKYVQRVPATGRMVRYWDLAGTRKKNKQHDPDNTAGALLARGDDLVTAICHIDAFQRDVSDRDAAMVSRAIEDRRVYGPRVVWWIEIEAGIEGERRTADLVRKLQAVGMVVRTEHPTGSKIDRADPVSGAVKDGNVVIVAGGDWILDFQNEAADFPNGNHDDRIDAVSGAYAKLNERTTIDFERMMAND